MANKTKNLLIYTVRGGTQFKIAVPGEMRDLTSPTKIAHETPCFKAEHRGAFLEPRARSCRCLLVDPDTLISFWNKTSQSSRITNRASRISVKRLTRLSDVLKSKSKVWSQTANTVASQYAGSSLLLLCFRFWKLCLVDFTAWTSNTRLARCRITKIIAGRSHEASEIRSKTRKYENYKT